MAGSPIPCVLKRGCVLPARIPPAEPAAREALEPPVMRSCPLPEIVEAAGEASTHARPSSQFDTRLKRRDRERAPAARPPRAACRLFAGGVVAPAHERAGRMPAA